MGTIAGRVGPACSDADVATVLDDLDRYTDAPRRRSLSGSLLIDVDGGAARLLAFGPGGHEVTVVARGTSADVVLRGDAATVCGVLTGEVQPGLAILGGQLHLTGDTELALGFAEAVLDPRSGAPLAVRALDPIDVATALAGTPLTHLREVLATGMRDVVLDEIVDRLPSFLDIAKARGVRLSVGFRLLGRADGAIDRFVVSVADGRACVVRSDAETGTSRATSETTSRDATVTCEASDFLLLATGHLSAVAGVLRGRLKVRGDRAAALRLSSMMAIPRANEAIS